MPPCRHDRFAHHGGTGAIRALCALRTNDDDRPRILVLTTYDTDRDIRAAMDADANGYLLKDTRRPELVRAVHDLADGRPVLTASALEVLTGPARADLADRSRARGAARHRVG